MTSVPANGRVNMKFLKYGLAICALGLFTTSAWAVPAGLAPYTDNPLVEFLARQRYHLFVSTQIDTSSNDHDTLGLVGGIGYFPTEKASVGLYGSVRNSDRRFPRRMRQMIGFGLFTEYNLAPYSAVQPFGGLRLGFIDSSGHTNPTSAHAALLGGLKFAFNRNVALSISGVFNWTEDDILDYKEDDDGTFSSSDTDLGVEIGLRFGF